MALLKRPIRSAKPPIFGVSAMGRFLKVYVAGVPAAAKHVLGRGHPRRDERYTRHGVAAGILGAMNAIRAMGSPRAQPAARKRPRHIKRQVRHQAGAKRNGHTSGRARWVCQDFLAGPFVLSPRAKPRGLAVRLGERQQPRPDSSTRFARPE